MKKRMAAPALFLSVCFAGWRMAGAQEPATSEPAGLPANLDHALIDPITIDADQQPLADFADVLRKITRTNIVLNWSALARAGVTRQTPVDVHLKNLPFEEVVKALVAILPATGTPVNYTVGDNILSITTDADLGKGNVPVIYDLSHAVSYSLEKSTTADDRAANGKFLEALFRAELEHEGEPMDAKGHALAVQGEILAATVSARGKGILDRTLERINAPTKPGQYFPGTQLTAAAKKTAAVMAGVHDSPADLAKHAADHPHDLNIALLPGTSEALAANPPGELASTITPGGVVLVGPAEAMHKRTVLAVYDLRDLLRHMAAANRGAAPADLQAQIVESLKTTVPPFISPADIAATAPHVGPMGAGGWTDFGKGDFSITPMNGILVVYAIPETQRAITAALLAMGR